MTDSTIVHIRCAKRSRGFQHQVELRSDGVALFHSHLAANGKPMGAHALSHEARLALVRNGDEDAGRYTLDRGCYAIACYITNKQQVTQTATLTKVDPLRRMSVEVWLDKYVAKPRSNRNNERRQAPDLYARYQRSKHARWREVWAERSNLWVLHEMEALGRMAPEGGVLVPEEMRRNLHLPVGYRVFPGGLDYLRTLGVERAQMPVP